MACSTEVVSDKCFSKKRKIGHHVRSYISDKNTQTDEFFRTPIPEITYGDELVPVHPDALDMLPNDDAYELIRKKNGRILLRRIVQLRKTATNADKVKSLVTREIIRRISRRSRKRDRDLTMVYRRMKPRYQITQFRMTKSHRKLTHHFLREYMVKGEMGLPVFSNFMDPVDTDDEFEKVIKQQYAQKSANYEEKHTPFHKRVTANVRRMLSEGNTLHSESSDELDISSSSADEKPKNHSRKYRLRYPRKKATQSVVAMTSESTVYPDSVDSDKSSKMSARPWAK